MPGRCECITYGHNPILSFNPTVIYKERLHSNMLHSDIQREKLHVICINCKIDVNTNTFPKGTLESLQDSDGIKWKIDHSEIPVRLANIEILNIFTFKSHW